MRALSAGFLSLLLIVSLGDFGRSSDCRAAEPASELAVKEVDPGVGAWEGKLDVGAAKLRLVFHFERDDQGAWSGTMDSPDQGANGLPLKPVTWKDGEVTCEMKAISGVFSGKLDADKKKIEGEWRQGGQKFPLSLSKVDKVSEPERPQEPKPPFPYREEEVSFAGLTDDVKLAGTLTLPEGNGPFAAVILISGSGQQDRNEEIFGHKPFLVLADALTRRGVAVLRVDDRGVGGSTGEVAKATSNDFADDVRAEIKYLTSRKEIDPKRIGLAGHSEGGLIAPLVAAENPDVAFLVLLAAPGVTGEEILYRQGTLIARAMGADEKTLTRQRKQQERMFAVLREKLDDAATEAKVRKVMDATIAELTEAEKKVVESQRGAMEQQFKMMQSPWFRNFLTHDPRPALKKITCPVLAITGEKDLQVDPKQNLPELKKAFAASGNEQVRIEELPGLNHLFQTCTTGSIAEYGQITETFSPAALEIVTDWIVKQSGTKE